MLKYTLRHLIVMIICTLTINQTDSFKSTRKKNLQRSLIESLTSLKLLKHQWSFAVIFRKITINWMPHLLLKVVLKKQKNLNEILSIFKEHVFI